MKKIATFILSVVLMLSFSICAFADMVPSAMKYSVVYAGPNGAKLTYQRNADKEKTIIVPAGTVMCLYDFVDKNGGRFYYGYYEGIYGIVDYSTVIQSGEIVKSDVGKNLGHKVNAQVTSDSGLGLRTGPSGNYESVGLLPQGTTVSYEYVFNNDSVNWGYITYNGKDGWINLSFVDEIPSETTKKSETTTETKPATESVAQSETQTDTSTKIATETTSENQAEYLTKENTDISAANIEVAKMTVSKKLSETTDSTASAMSETGNRAVIGVTAAIIVCITAAVVILLIKRKKNLTK